MPQADATREFCQLAELISNGERLIFATRGTDLLYDASKIGVPQSIGFLADGRSLLTERVQGPCLLGILQLVDLLGQMNHKRVKGPLNIGILLAQRTNGFSSCIHEPCIGLAPSQLNTIRDKKRVLSSRGIKNRQDEDFAGGRFQSK